MLIRPETEEFEGPGLLGRPIWVFGALLQKLYASALRSRNLSSSRSHKKLGWYGYHRRVREIDHLAEFFGGKSGIKRASARDDGHMLDT